MALTLADCLKYQNAPPSVAAFKHKLLEGNVALAQKYGLEYTVGGEVQRLPVMPAVPTPVGAIPAPGPLPFVAEPAMVPYAKTMADQPYMGKLYDLTGKTGLEYGIATDLKGKPLMDIASGEKDMIDLDEAYKASGKKIKGNYRMIHTHPPSSGGISFSSSDIAHLASDPKLQHTSVVSGDFVYDMSKTDETVPAFNDRMWKTVQEHHDKSMNRNVRKLGMISEELTTDEKWLRASDEANKHIAQRYGLEFSVNGEVQKLPPAIGRTVKVKEGMGLKSVEWLDEQGLGETKWAVEQYEGEAVKISPWGQQQTLQDLFADSDFNPEVAKDLIAKDFVIAKGGNMFNKVERDAQRPLVDEFLDHFDIHEYQAPGKIAAPVPSPTAREAVRNKSFLTATATDLGVDMDVFNAKIAELKKSDAYEDQWAEARAEKAFEAAISRKVAGGGWSPKVLRKAMMMPAAMRNQQPEMMDKLEDWYEFDFEEFNSEAIAKEQKDMPVGGYKLVHYSKPNLVENLDPLNSQEWPVCRDETDQAQGLGNGVWAHIQKADRRPGEGMGIEDGALAFEIDPEWVRDNRNVYMHRRDKIFAGQPEWDSEIRHGSEIKQSDIDEYVKYHSNEAYMVDSIPISPEAVKTVTLNPNSPFWDQGEIEDEPTIAEMKAFYENLGMNVKVAPKVSKAYKDRIDKISRKVAKAESANTHYEYTDGDLEIINPTKKPDLEKISVDIEIGEESQFNDVYGKGAEKQISEAVAKDLQKHKADILEKKTAEHEREWYINDIKRKTIKAEATKILGREPDFMENMALPSLESFKQHAPWLPEKEIPKVEPKVTFSSFQPDKAKAVAADLFGGEKEFSNVRDKFAVAVENKLEKNKAAILATSEKTVWSSDMMHGHNDRRDIIRKFGGQAELEEGAAIIGRDLTEGEKTSVLQAFDLNDRSMTIPWLQDKKIASKAQTKKAPSDPTIPKSITQKKRYGKRLTMYNKSRKEPKKWDDVKDDMDVVSREYMNPEGSARNDVLIKGLGAWMDSGADPTIKGTMAKTMKALSEGEDPEDGEFFTRLKGQSQGVFSKVYADKVDKEGYVSVYRGTKQWEGELEVGQDSKIGVRNLDSWSLDKDVAENFADFTNTELYEIKIKAKDVNWIANFTTQEVGEIYTFEGEVWVEGQNYNMKRLK